ncbi:hypothetical protein Hroenn_gp29 [Pelagibacter phage Hroenn EXVC015P]|nr:hypothetical protein Hroenn_gp29 [Pelagibacter phage Hroenn EXVC015P]QLF88579.1 hypothetical protein Unn_gp21 [Pelagibacter phage Unn EXVC019P]
MYFEYLPMDKIVELQSKGIITSDNKINNNEENNGEQLYKDCDTGWTCSVSLVNNC